MGVLAGITAVAAGGALGSTARYLIARMLNGAFPLGTLCVNVAGCFAMGVLTARMDDMTPPWHVFLMTGFLGGFTTFSAFTFDTYMLTRDAMVAQAALYMAATIVLSFVAFFAGYVLSRKFGG